MQKVVFVAVPFVDGEADLFNARAFSTRQAAEQWADSIPLRTRPVKLSSGWDVVDVFEYDLDE